MPHLRPSFMMIGLLLVLSAWICSEPPPPPDRVAIETRRLPTLTPTAKATPTAPPTPTATPTPTPTETPTFTFTPPPAPTLPPPTLTAVPAYTPLPTQNGSASNSAGIPTTVIDCSHARLTSPAGADNWQDANNFPAANSLTLTWEPPLPTPVNSDCAQAHITAPAGADTQPEANNYPVSNQVIITWEPSDCLMTVEFYQSGNLGGKFLNMASGSQINLGNPGSGDTEIKIWQEGLTEPADVSWVKVE